MDNEFLYNIINSIDDPVFVKNAAHEFIVVNDAFCRLVGREREELLGKSDYDFFPREEADVFRAKDELVFKEMKPDENEESITNSRGAVHTISTKKAVFLFNDDQKILVGVIRDVTDLKLAQTNLRKAKEEAEQANEAKNKFLSNVSHEMRNPLNSVIGLADLLAETKLDEKQTEFIRVIKKSGERLLTQINDLLDYNRYISGEPYLENEPFSLYTLVADLQRENKVLAAKENIHFEAEIVFPGTPEYLIGDVERLRQILANLITNAIKFTDEGGVQFHVAMARHDEQSGIAELYFELRDTGIGIAEDKLDTIFKSFAQSDLATSRKFGGTGLGLSISKKLVTDMGGAITVSSTPGAGSVFAVRLPFRVVPSNVDAETEQQNINLDDALQGKHILLAEDDEDNAALIRNYFAGTGALLRHVPNGQQAVELASRETFDLILLDIEMPVMDGYKATWFIRTQGESIDTPILILSAYASRVERQKCLDLGASEYLTKPLRKQTLYAAVQKWVG